MWVDVRVRINEWDCADFIVERLSRRVVKHGCVLWCMRSGVVPPLLQWAGGICKRQAGLSTDFLFVSLLMRPRQFPNPVPRRRFPLGTPGSAVGNVASALN